MNKKIAIELLGGTVTSVAAAIGINPSAVSQWPNELPPKIADRVIAACVRHKVKIPKGLFTVEKKS